MGKGTELWDDSALVNAFESAMTSYKQEMHSNGDCRKSLMHGENTSDCYERDIVHSEKEARHIKPGTCSNNTSSDVTEIETQIPYNNTEAAAADFSRQGNTFGADKDHTNSNSYPSGFSGIVEETSGYSAQQNSECDELVKQYYELEEQKQRITEQLHKANYWTYQTPNQSSSYQPPQVPGYGASEYSSCPICSLIPTSACATGYYCYPAQMAGNCSYPVQMACCSASQAHEVYVDPGKHSNVVDSAINEGMLALERTAEACKAGEDEKGKEHGPGLSEGEELQSISSDLSAALNAWYAAGFYTGRYLFSEQSKKKTHK